MKVDPVEKNRKESKTNELHVQRGLKTQNGEEIPLISTQRTSRGDFCDSEGKIGTGDK